MGEWDGKDRRRQDRPDTQESHDILIRLDANLSNFMKRFEEHAEADEKHFEKLDDGQDVLRKYLWIGIRAIAAVEIVVKLLVK